MTQNTSLVTATSDAENASHRYETVAARAPMDVQFGRADHADFAASTWTFDMDGAVNWQVAAGDFAIMPRERYEALAAENARLRADPQEGNWVAANDVHRNVKLLDEALNGPGGATRPLLIDLLSQVQSEAGRLGMPVLAALNRSHSSSKPDAQDGHLYGWPNALVGHVLNTHEDVVRLRDYATGRPRPAPWATLTDADYLGRLADSFEVAATRASAFLSENEYPRGPIAGFMIAHVDGKRWRTMDTLGMPEWTEDPAQALCVSLREHADAYAADDPEDVRIRFVARAPQAPADVMKALDRMCTPLHESCLGGETAKADAHCMEVIRDFILSRSGMSESRRQALGEALRELLLEGEADDGSESTDWNDAREIDRVIDGLAHLLAPVELDATYYRRLRVVGVAPCGSPHLGAGEVLRFTNLDDWIAADITAHPSRGGEQ